MAVSMFHELKLPQEPVGVYVLLPDFVPDRNSVATSSPPALAVGFCSCNKVNPQSH